MLACAHTSYQLPVERIHDQPTLHHTPTFLTKVPPLTTMSLNAAPTNPSPAFDLIRELKKTTIEALSPPDCLLLAHDLIASSHASDTIVIKHAPPTTNVPPLPSTLLPVLVLGGGLKHRSSGAAATFGLIGVLKKSIVEALSPPDCLLLSLDLIASSHASSATASTHAPPAAATTNVPSPSPSFSSIPTATVSSGPMKGGGILGLKRRPSGARVAPHFSGVSSLSVTESPDEFLDDDKEQLLPRLSSMMLNHGGNFVYAGVPRSKSARASFAHCIPNEDRVMDNNAISYVDDVSLLEKREVFQLPAVHRSMRRLNYADILMSEEVLMLAKRYMEVGPSRASLLHIGYDSLQEVCNEKTLIDEMDYISPTLRMLVYVRGYHWIGFVVQTIACLCELSYYFVHIHRRGSVDLVSGIALVSCLPYYAMHSIVTFTVAFKSKPLTADTPLESIRSTGLSYVRLHGLDILAAAQHRLAHEAGRSIAPSADLSLFRKRLVSSTLTECFVIHFLIGAVPIVWSFAVTSVRSYERGDLLVSVLAAASTWSRLVVVLGLTYSAFVVRLSQKMSEFEIRRVEADIRTIKPNLTHRITPRYLALLHEIHLIGNRSHSHFALLVPALLVSTVQVLGSLILSFGAKSGVAGACFPSWSFCAFFQPLVTLFAFVYGFSTSNLALQRDVHQDIVEMNIRLTFSERDVPNWLLQQMVCLERIDGRAFYLPMGIVPSVAMSWKIVSSFVASLLFLGPYLVSIADKLTVEVLCPAENGGPTT